MAKITYINKVEIIEASQLASSTFLSNGVFLQDNLGWTSLCLVGLASWEISDKVEGKNRIFHHSLKATLSEKVEVDNHKWCFRLTAVDGSEYLLGNDSRPYPVLQQTDSHPSDVGQSCAVMLEATWKSTGFYPIL